MKKIRIHKLINNDFPRCHQFFYGRFDKYLSNFFDCDIVNCPEPKDGSTRKIDLSKADISSFGRNPQIMDTDYVVENLETGEVKICSFTEYFNNFVSHFAKSGMCSKVVLAHFNYHNLYHWLKREGGNAQKYMAKVVPWIYPMSQPYNVEYYRFLRKNSKLNEKMLFLGSRMEGDRIVVQDLHKLGIMQDLEITNFEPYFEKVAKTKIALSLYYGMDQYLTPFDWPGEMCYRDIEYISLGVPFIRIEYKDSLYNRLVPNKHYISIPRDVAYRTYDSGGNEALAKLYKNTFDEVKDDNWFLSYISKNQLEWYKNNIEAPNFEKLTFGLLGMEEWL